jgi:hypothetical protein
MRWFRDPIGQSTWLALIALAMNLGLSFGATSRRYATAVVSNHDPRATAGERHACPTTAARASGDCQRRFKNPPSCRGDAGAGNRRQVLPETRVAAPVERRQPRARPPQVVANLPPAPTQAQVVAKQNQVFDTGRQNILAPLGAGTYQLNHQAIEALPQGANTGLDKVLLQTPGVSQDSAASGDLHVRNEHGNVQYRINGIQLPDGVGAFGQILDTGFIGSLSLITGALPAQYGLRTAGIVNIQTKADAFNNSGSVSLYGGSHQTQTPYFEYGGTAGQTQYFVTGRYLKNNLRIENPTPSNGAIHDHTSQEKGFAYLSTVIDPTSRLTFMSGTYNAAFQIPDRPLRFSAYRALDAKSTMYTHQIGSVVQLVVSVEIGNLVIDVAHRFLV